MRLVLRLVLLGLVLAVALGCKSTTTKSNNAPKDKPLAVPVGAAP
jgi:hypothetical protein